MFGDFIKQGHPDIEDPYTKLVITAFRFDPCGPVYPNDGDMKKCVLPNIRLIAQVYDKGKATTAALHMVFALGVKLDQERTGIQLGVGFDPDVRRRVISELLQMKARNAANGIVTGGAPVGIHPAFSATWRDSARTREFEAEFEQFVRRFAVESAYFTTAVMFTQNPSVVPREESDGEERWVWEKANVVRRNPQTGQLLAVPTLVFGGIPGFDPNRTQQSLTANSESRHGTQISPASTIQNGGVPNSAILSILKPASEFDWGRLQEAVDVADTMDNPDRVFVQTDDCVSCHVASTARSYALRDGRLSWVKRSNAFKVDARSAGLNGSLSPEDAIWQSSEGYRVMSLAFFKGRPSISQRVVNETLQAARLLNRNSR